MAYSYHLGFKLNITHYDLIPSKLHPLLPMVPSLPLSPPLVHTEMSHVRYSKPGKEFSPGTKLAGTLVSEFNWSAWAILT